MNIDIPTSDIKPTCDEDMKCAPTKSFEDGSCIPLDLLIDLAIAYNKQHSDKIPLLSTYEILNPKKYKRFLVKQFKDRLDKICEGQQCWIKQSFIKQMDFKRQRELKQNTFRPIGPTCDKTTQFTWLNTVNIDQVNKQYEYKHPDFIFLGAVPIDFDDLSDYPIKNLNFNDLLSKGKSKIGVIFNLDRHDQPGSHWVALYADLQGAKVYFFDSYGYKPHERIVKFIKRICTFIREELVLTPIAEYNKVRHQYKGSECGVYSICFIIRLLKGDSFETLSNNVVSDDKINKCRDFLFSREVKIKSG